MAQPFPLPPETRQTPTLFGDGVSATYGPFSFKAFETGDIKVYRKLATDIRFAEAAVVVTKTTGQPQDTFTVTFPAVQLATTRFVVVAKRLHTRTTGLDKGLGLSVNALEKELSKQGTILQELRRDIEERAIKADYDIDVPTLIEQGVEGHLLIFGPNNTIINTEKTIDEILAAQLAAEAAAAAAAASAIEAANSASDAAGSATDAANSAIDAADAAALAQAVVGTISGAPLETVYDWTGILQTHVFHPDCKFFQVIGCGGGAAGISTHQLPWFGDVACPGGASGHFGETEILPLGVGAIATVFVGQGGTAVNENLPFPATNGGNSIFTLTAGAVTKFTFRGGVTHANTYGTHQNPRLLFPQGNYAQLPLETNLRTSQNLGGFGVTGMGEYSGTTCVESAPSGQGGSTPWGRGGLPVTVKNLVMIQDGENGQGFGSGGSGACATSNGSLISAIGGNGAPGRIIVREWYVP